MPDSGVEAFAQDADGVFWVGTDKGLCALGTTRGPGSTPASQQRSSRCFANRMVRRGRPPAHRCTRFMEITRAFPHAGISFGAIRGLVRCANGDIVVCGSPPPSFAAIRWLPCGKPGISSDNSTRWRRTAKGALGIGTSRASITAITARSPLFQRRMVCPLMRSGPARRPRQKSMDRHRTGLTPGPTGSQD